MNKQDIIDEIKGGNINSAVHDLIQKTANNA